MAKLGWVMGLLFACLLISALLGGPLDLNLGWLTILFGVALFVVPVTWINIDNYKTQKLRRTSQDKEEKSEEIKETSKDAINSGRIERHGRSERLIESDRQLANEQREKANEWADKLNNPKKDD